MVADRECPASISGLCLQLTEGLDPCDEGECDREVLDRAFDKARALAEAPVPRRASRRPTRARRRY